MTLPWRCRWPMLAAALACLAGSAPSALAEGCPGSGPGRCPYAAAQVIGQRAESVLRFPEAVAVDEQGDVYVADQLSYVVQKFTATGAFETEWGSYGGGHGQFGPIGGLATDAAGNVYVLDSSHNRIEKFSSAGAFITAWGQAGSGLGQFSFGSSQDYTKPPGGGIAVAGNYVYVADSGNNRVERFNLEGGEALQWGSQGSGPGQFSYPRAVAANATEVLVSDGVDHRIEKFNPEGAFEAEAGSAGTGGEQFAFPYGVALDAAANVYVADDLNHRIVKLSPSLHAAGVWGGFGSKPGQLAFPRALAAGPAGDTYVADTANDRVEVFGPQGEYLRVLGASARAPAQLTAPRGLATDPSGQLFVSDADDNRIERFSAGNAAFAEAWTTAGGNRPGFNGPSGIGIDPRGSVYVADQGDERIVRLWGDGTYLSELGGPAQIGGAQLNGAGAVAVASQTGRTFVADSGHNRVLVYGADGSLLAKWGAGGGDGEGGSGVGAFNHPSAIAVAPGPAGAGAERVYVSDEGNDRIVELSGSGVVLRQWGAQGSADGEFAHPQGVAVDEAANVYVVDGQGNRVEVFDSEGRFLEKWGLRGTDLGEFSQPSAIAVDCAGDVFVADTNNNRVERFELVAPAQAGCLAPGEWPPPLDVAPVVHVSLLRHTGVIARRALALSVSCERGCKLLITATLSPRSRRRDAVPLIAAARALPRALPGQVRLLLGPTALRRLRRELGRRRSLTAYVHLSAVGPTGRRTTAVRIFAVQR